MLRFRESAISRAPLTVTALAAVRPALAWAHERAPEAPAAGGGNPLFSIDLGLSIWTIVVFLVLLWVLRRFAWRPILGALEAREARIEEAIAEAVRTREEAEQLLQEHRRRLAEAREHAQEILAQARQAAEKLRRETEERARRESDEILERARREIEREKQRALDVLRREAVDLAMAAASRLLRRRLDAEADRALVVEYLDAVTRQEEGVRA